ncbi:MAG: V-type ATP synthase subunit D [Chloroflexi bacterium]|nr:V-type ATP synthase subunit D [Anaerolineales bacterium]MCE7919060.1 V-type ATP synthase subunit D [Chloroflexi bacterium CFX1]MCQ3952461.1 V-type ATP synthase subunit D [Chloroflexota bacterium]MDL1919148.1 V-type ATP synthase subunit D [Chloroflexi bacterium CFX5]MCK6567454.1 V-type ATP synthase subunit D [Anaerolineales bacterium]
MPQINIAPTRTNLIRLKKELRFAKEGYEILDRKREALTGELVRVAKEADALQKEVWALLKKAYDSMEKARLVMGSDHVEWAALAVNKTVEVQLRLRGVMGVALPQIEAVGEPPKLPYSPGDTSAVLDEASDSFREVLLRIPQLSMLTAAVWRLANELRKTQRRVNALQHIFIPQYKHQIEFIVSSLEEREREETFRLKWLKTKMTKATVE